MVMHTRKQPRLSDGCNDRRDSQPYQTHKSQPKSQSTTLHRQDKMRDGLSDPTPPYKMLRHSDESTVNKHSDGHSKTKTFHTLRGQDGGTSCSPQENSHNHSSNSHSNQSKASDTPHEPADDWSEHISSSGKKYYYNCRTEVSQWEKPKDWLEREQRQKDPSKRESNTFPKDRDYRRESVDTATTKSTSGDKPSSNTAPSQSSSSTNPGLNQASGSNPTPSSSSSMVPVSPSVQSQASGLLQDPALLRQLLPALQATLQMSNGSMDMAKINEVLAAAVTQASLQSMLHKLLTAGPSAFNITALLSQAAQHSNQAALQASQSPISLTSDASSPRSYVSPRNGTPQTNLLTQKPLLSMPPAASQPKVTPVKPGPASQQASAEKRPEDPRTLQQRSSQGSPPPGPNGNSTGGHSVPNAASGLTSAPSSFTPSLASHFDENLVRHIQNWPAEHIEKQAARLREDAHNMGSLYMSEICTELKNLRSLVRVCEIQATLREQRILFLRQQSKELDKLKNQNSYMV
ncbi:WW domain-containing adapter protein with coiled-coil isoform X1 [Salmo salar]|uniref:WW domain-containing adapter protein with coiled-coil isoform X1 n=1 Tax=Salmo salar TaxID=8030 RepID=A0A1S3PWY5_SALSA|nr:WW domain-containing adapter protein with coiled-coil-like isoform X1 [Salmo salar]|eukprot:XP_014032223.1 PREDICTED: WW domain-containing adapter protein with coiled-coil-like isoform X1 [Salmo salar]